MKIFSALCFLLSALALSAQPVLRSTLTTNSALANAAMRGAVYVSGALGSDTNALPGPFASITVGNANAVSGQTVVVTDGTFQETIYPKPGVNFHFNGGVVAVGPSSSAVFRITNNAAQLKVTGLGAFTNGTVYFDGCTGSVANVECRVSETTGTSYSAYHVLGTSNRCYLVASESVNGSLVGWFDAGYTNRISETYITARQSVLAKPTPNAGGHSNTVVSITAPVVMASGSGFFNTPARLVLNGGYFSRNGQTVTTVGTNCWFKGVSCNSSNTDAGATVFNFVHGNFWFEQEHTAINNP